MIDIQDLMQGYYTAVVEELDNKYMILSFENHDHDAVMNVSTKELKQLKENINRLFHVLKHIC